MSRLQWMPVLATLGLLGCGPSQGFVEGTVTVDGKPVDKGTIVLFSPLGQTRIAQATVGEGGKYRLQTSGKDGIMPGDYKVMIVNYQNYVELPLDVSPDDASDPRWLAYAAKLESMRNQPPKPGMPPHEYSNIATTPLKCSVPAGHSVQDFAIESKPTK